MSTVIGFSFSKSAMKLVNDGVAKISSGGIRRLTGELIELGKPVLKTALNFSSVSTAASLGAEIHQSIMLNTINTKMDTVLSQLSNIAKSLQSLGQIQVLSWVTAAFSLANCCISIAGFHKTLEKLKSIGGELHEFYDRYKSDREHDRLDACAEAIDNLQNDIAFLMERYENSSFVADGFQQRESSIEEHFSRAKNLLSALLRDVQDSTLDGKIGFPMIFTLSAVYAQTLNEYTCQYYYAHGKHHSRYGTWIEILKDMEGTNFKSHLKRHFLYHRDYIRLSPAAKSGAFFLAAETIREQNDRLRACAALLDEISEQDYREMESRIEQGFCSEINRYMAENDIDLDRLLHAKITSDEYSSSEKGDSVLLSVQIPG